MIGALIGDIVGSDYEFNNTFDYNFPLFAEGSDFTDDTICTVAVADAILNNIDYEDATLKWCREYPFPKGMYGGYFNEWINSENPLPYNSFGNGAAMRVSPVAWLFEDEENVRREAEATAAITHSHPEGIKGALAIAVAIYRMRKAENKDGNIFEEVAKEFYGDDAFKHLPEKGVFDVTCQGCVPLSLHIASKATSFEDAIRKTVSYGGDTDTVGAIVGSLAEAQYSIPSSMKKKAITFLPSPMKAILSQFDNAFRSRQS